MRAAQNRGARRLFCGACSAPGLRGQLFSVATDFSVGALAEPFLALGSGHLRAYGALHILADLALPAEVKVRRALETAARFTANVRPPFIILDSRMTHSGPSATSNFR